MTNTLALRAVREHQCYTAGVPQLRQLSEVRPGHWLDRDAAHAFDRMAAAAREDGIDLVIVSAWRAHEHQQRLRKQWDAKLEALEYRRTTGLIKQSDYDEQKKELLKVRPATPGWSKHQNGLAVDLLRSHDVPPKHETGPTDAWLAVNAKRFGYYRTVPGELWHWEALGELPDDEHGVIR